MRLLVSTAVIFRGVPLGVCRSVPQPGCSRMGCWVIYGAFLLISIQSVIGVLIGFASRGCVAFYLGWARAGGWVGHLVKVGGVLRGSGKDRGSPRPEANLQPSRLPQSTTKLAHRHAHQLPLINNTMQFNFS